MSGNNRIGLSDFLLFLDHFGASTAPQVIFAAAGLEAAVREVLDWPTGAIPPAEAAAVRILHANGRDLDDLAGIEWLTGLTQLNLQENELRDVSPLAHLTRLQVLYLGFNELDDVSPLAHLTRLVELDLQQNGPLEDLSPLSGLTLLRSLLLTYTEVDDVSPLAGLTRLRNLTLHGNQIVDLSPLARLRLQSLALQDNQIVDLSPLAGMTSLRLLELDGNQIGDIGPLAGLTGLNVLRLVRNHIDDLSPLVENVGLGPGDFIAVEENPLSPEALAEQIPALQERGVNIAFHPVATPTVFADSALAEAVEETVAFPVGDAAPGVFAEVMRMVARGRGIRHLSGIGQLAQLTRLDLSGNQIVDLGPLADLTQLRWLDLSGNQIADLVPLAGLTQLLQLDLGGNQIGDLGPLENLGNLQLLHLQDNQIADINPLVDLHQLTELDLGGNQIVDVSALVENIGLDAEDVVYLDGNPLSPEARSVQVPILQDRTRALVASVRPQLHAPSPGQILDNGCTDRSNGIVWIFDWADVPGASRYHLHVTGARALFPAISNAQVPLSTYQHRSDGSYIIFRHQRGWTWRVRAQVDGLWGPWSQERTFDVEDLNADCP